MIDPTLLDGLKAQRAGYGLHECPPCVADQNEWRRQWQTGARLDRVAEAKAYGRD